LSVAQANEADALGNAEVGRKALGKEGYSIFELNNVTLFSRFAPSMNLRLRLNCGRKELQA